MKTVTWILQQEYRGHTLEPAPMVVVSGPGYHITRGGSAEVWQTRFSYGRDALVVLFCLQFDRRGGLIGTSWGVCKDLAAQIIVWVWWWSFAKALWACMVLGRRHRALERTNLLHSIYSKHYPRVTIKDQN